MAQIWKTMWMHPAAYHIPVESHETQESTLWFLQCRMPKRQNVEFEFNSNTFFILFLCSCCTEHFIPETFRWAWHFFHFHQKWVKASDFFHFHQNSVAARSKSDEGLAGLLMGKLLRFVCKDGQKLGLKSLVKLIFDGLFDVGRRHHFFVATLGQDNRQATFQELGEFSDDWVSQWWCHFWNCWKVVVVEK